MESLFSEAAKWVDSEECAQDIRDRFDGYVVTDLQLLEHRTYIEQNHYGMGERCFHWLWRLVIDAMPNHFRFLEVGVYKGQVLSLVKMLADRTGKHADVTGVTLLSDFSGVKGEFPKYPDEDYAKYIRDLHDRYDLVQPRLIVGDSTDPDVQQAVEALGSVDLLYVDGCHEYEYVVKDLLFYPGLVKPACAGRPGGLLVVDDCSNNLTMPWGFFQGIEPVSRAVRTIIETDPQWEHLLAVVHNRVWRKT